MGTPDIHIRIPRKLHELINELVVKEGYYRSAPEFILKCTRAELDQIKKYNIDQRKIKIYWHRFRQEKEDGKMREERINP
jgi:Arc/MetJ-type ribon-helix-helix transcriptional regulator